MSHYSRLFKADRWQLPTRTVNKASRIIGIACAPGLAVAIETTVIRTLRERIAAEPVRWAIFFALFLWGGCYVGLVWYFGVPENPGIFGDMFGAVNALFSAATAVGLVFTVVQQQKQARLAEEDRAQAAADRVQAQKDAAEERLHHAEQIAVMKRTLEIEHQRVTFEAKPIFSLKWRDCSVKQDRSQWALGITNDGGPAFLLQYELRSRCDKPGWSGSLYQMSLVGKLVDAPIGIPESFTGEIDVGFVQLRDGIQGTVTFEILESRHREPRFVRQKPGPVDLSAVFNLKPGAENSSANIFIPPPDFRSRHA